MDRKQKKTAIYTILGTNERQIFFILISECVGGASLKMRDLAGIILHPIPQHKHRVTCRKQGCTDIRYLNS